MRAGFEYYRASFEDAKQNKEYVAKQKLDIPILTIGGEAGFGNLTTTSFQKFANNVTGITLPNTGHFHSIRKTKFCYKTDTRIFQITLFFVVNFVYIVWTHYMLGMIVPKDMV